MSEYAYFHFGDILDDAVGLSEEYLLSVWKNCSDFEHVVECDHYSKGRSANLNGHPDTWSPSEPEEIELSEDTESLFKLAWDYMQADLPNEITVPCLGKRDAESVIKDQIIASTEILKYCKEAIETIKQTYSRSFEDDDE